MLLQLEDFSCFGKHKYRDGTQKKLGVEQKTGANATCTHILCESC
jgi:hypothetical protein